MMMWILSQGTVQIEDEEDLQVLGQVCVNYES